MKAPDFLYHRASSVENAVALLREYGGNARILAGGQSLMPMMNMRLLRPSALIDINRLPDLSDIQCDGDDTTLGALVRYVDIERSPVVAKRLPLLTLMVRSIGDRQVRNRGTIGGSLVQGDPTGEIPLGCLVLGACAAATGPNGSRVVPIAAFYDGAYAARLQPDEMLIGVRFPKSPACYAFREVCRRHNDFALLSVAAVGNVRPDGRWTDIRVGIGGASEMPVLVSEIAAVLDGSHLADKDLEAAGQAALAAIDPQDDVRGSADYRRHLVPIYVRRVLQDLRLSARPTPAGGQAA